MRTGREVCRSSASAMNWSTSPLLPARSRQYRRVAGSSLPCSSRFKVDGDASGAEASPCPQRPRRPGQPELVAVVEVFVARHQRENPLYYEVADAVGHVPLVAVVGEADGAALEEPHPQADLMGQNEAGVRRDAAAVEPALQPASRQPLERELRPSTLCRQ